MTDTVRMMEMIFGMVSRRNGWTVIMKNVRYVRQYEGTRWLERG